MGAFKIKRVGPRMKRTRLSMVEIIPDDGEAEVRFGYYSGDRWREILNRESTVELVEALKEKDFCFKLAQSYNVHKLSGKGRYVLGYMWTYRQAAYEHGTVFRIGCCMVGDDELRRLKAWLDKHTEIVEE